jgi:hypothetical protein
MNCELIYNFTFYDNSPLSTGLDAFVKDYPFCLVSKRKKRKTTHSPYVEIDSANIEAGTEDLDSEEDALCGFCTHTWPSEILKGMLYLGINLF